MNAKPIDSLQVSDLEKYPVWRFTDDVSDDTAVCPVERLPVSSLSGKVIGVRVSLANGQSPWAMIGNLDTNNAQLNEHLVTVSINGGGQWFQLARYHDPNYADQGPEALARFLGMGLDDVFPISYDVRKYVRGDDTALAGFILKEPRVRLTRAQIIALAVP